MQCEIPFFTSFINSLSVRLDLISPTFLKLKLEIALLNINFSILFISSLSFEKEIIVD